MNFLGWWKSKHYILKSRSFDEIDEITAGKVFKIRYLGCISLNKGESCEFNKIADGVLNSIPNDVLKKMPRLELFMDSKYLSVSETGSSRNNLLLEVFLSDVRDVLRKQDRHYSNICIFIARSSPASQHLKAHVVCCDSSKQAQELLDTFRNAFKVFNYKKDEKNDKKTSAHEHERMTRDIRYVSIPTLASTFSDENDNKFT